MENRVILSYPKATYAAIIVIAAILIAVGIGFYSSDVARSWLFISIAVLNVIVCFFRLTYRAIIDEKGVAVYYFGFIRRKFAWNDFSAKRYYRSVRREVTFSTRNNGARLFAARLYPVNGRSVAFYSDMKGYEQAVLIITLHKIKDKK